MKVIGKETIHPFLFYSGKISGYAAWVLNLLSILNIVRIGRPPLTLLIASFILTGAGLLITLVSLINLGKSTRLGLPAEATEFKTGGLYSFSRNPMYLGFDLLTLSSVILTWNIFTALLGLYSIAVYHLIVLGEERFLEKRFGNKYGEYKNRVRRYL